MKRVWISTMEVNGPAVSCSYLLRAEVPKAFWNFYADPEASSLMDDAFDSDNEEVREGRVVERRHSADWDWQEAASLAGDGIAFTAIMSDLERDANLFQEEINKTNRWGRFGTYYDDQSGWVVKGVEAK